jgi:L,D-transpeptidase ErfK/SrfK
LFVSHIEFSFALSPLVHLHAADHVQIVWWVESAMNGLISVVLFLAQMSGVVFSYTVQEGDSLTSLAARFGVETRVLAEANGLKTSSRLLKDQTMQIDNRHIVPPADGATIVINVPQRMLFYFEQDHFVAAYPVAAGKPTWKTPLGDFEIVVMEENPSWDVPVSIQEEMRRAGKPVVTRVPPSPANPLGDFWMGLSLPGIGLHGTNAPSSIYKLATHGCIRLHPDDVEQLFSNVDAGTPGRIIYEPILFARTETAVFLEVHPDAYKKVQDLLGRTMEIARAAGLADVLDYSAVKEVVRKRDGVPRDVSRR